MKLNIYWIAFTKFRPLLCVVCNMCDAGYRRLDGVYIVPITALKN